MILSLLLSLASLTATLRPPSGAVELAVVVGCENGWESASLKQLDDTKAFSFSTRGDISGKCVMEVKAVDRAGKVFKIERREFFGKS